MGVFDAVVEFERGVLERDEALKPVWERFAAAGEARVREVSRDAAFPSWPGTTSASALKAALVEAEVFAVLAEYAREVGPLVRAGDAERWEALVREAQRRSGEGYLGELHESVVGAASLRERFGCAPARRTQRGGIPCDCGYATDGTRPSRLCDECEDALLRRWVAEERRILRGMPGYAQEIAAVIADTEAKQRRILEKGSDEYSETFGQRKAGGRRLGRLRRAHRKELDAQDLRRWTRLGEMVEHSSTTSIRTTAAKTRGRGLGAAGITELGILADRESIRALTKKAENGTARRAAR
ncbi:hypothetical protein [Microbacterium sp. NPDC087868]|uniref:hypothetical protein n=1 Tax=Microbacterium sp. NPDC087868 TaxID=3364195 RepID=UPI00384E1D39